MLTLLYRKIPQKIAASIIILGLVTSITLYPWNAPVYDAQLSGFDRTYLYVDPRGSGASTGSISVASDELVITSSPGSKPLVDLASSELSFEVRFSVTVLKGTAGTPVRLTIFFPPARENVTVEFQAKDLSIMGYISHADSESRLSQRGLGRYTLGEPSDIALDIKRDNLVSITLSNRESSESYVVNKNDVPTLLTYDRRVVQVSSLSETDQSTIVLRNLMISVPHDDLFAPMTNDPTLVVVYSSAAFAILFLYRERLRKIPRTLALARTKLGKIPRAVWLIVLASLTVQILLTPLANHPHDIFSQKVWIYSLMNGGLSDLYFRPLVTVAAQPFGGVPNQHAVYPYPPLLGYFYYAASAPLVAFRITSVDSFAFEFLAKTINIMGNLVSGVLVYLIALELSISRKKVLTASTAYLMNPALIFDAAVWSSPDPILIMFLLGAIFFLIRRRTGLVWVCLGLALLTKQTALVPAVLIGALSFRYTGFQSNLRGLAIGFATAFLSIAPYILAGYSPFVIFSQTILRISQFAAGANSLPTSSPIAADAFSFLPLISPANGLVGRERMWYADVNLVPLIGLSYGTLGKILFGATALPVAWIGFKRASVARTDLAIMLVAFITLLSDFLPTRVSGRYFLIPLALLAPVAFARAGRWTRFSFWVLTATTFASMYYLIAGWSVWVPSALPNFNHAQLVDASFSLSYAVDRLLDLAIIMNLLGVMSLGRVLLENWRHHANGSGLRPTVAVA